MYSNNILASLYTKIINLEYYRIYLFKTNLNKLREILLGFIREEARNN